MRRFSAFVLFLGALTSLAPGLAAAQGASIQLSVDPAVAAPGQRFRVTVRYEASAQSSTGASPELTRPDLSGFRVVGEFPQVGHTVAFGSGGASMRTTGSVVYSLIADREGTFTIGPAQLRVGNQRIESNTVSVTIDADRGAAAGTGGGANFGIPRQPTPGAQPPGFPPGFPFNGLPGFPGSTTDPTSSDPVDPAQGALTNDAEASPPPEIVDPAGFVWTMVDEPTAYVGQQVTAHVYLYSSAPLAASPALSREPDADGFWMQSLFPAQRQLRNDDRRTIQGRNYYVYELRRFAAFPLRSGELAIGEAAVSFRAGQGFYTQSYDRSSAPARVQVLPLPDGAPADEVIVGEVTLDARLDRAVTSTGDAVTLTLLVEGSGNLLAYHPEIPSLEGLRVLEPRVDQEVQPNDKARSIEGRRRYEWLLIPERPGTFDLGPFAVATFDPRGARYARVESAAIVLEAMGEDLREETPDEDAAAAADDTPAPSAPSFGPIRRESALRRRQTALAAHPLFPLGIVGMPLLFALGVGLSRLRRRQRSRAAMPDPRTHLQEARERRKAGDVRGLYAALEGALRLAASRAVGENTTGMTRPALERALNQVGVAPDTIRGVLEELEICDFARFSSAAGGEREVEASLQRVARLVEELS